LAAVNQYIWDAERAKGLSGRHADLRDSEYRLSRQNISQRLPGSLFDARYDGLALHAARLDAAICRRQDLR